MDAVTDGLTTFLATLARKTGNRKTVVIMNTSPVRRELLTNNYYTIIGFLLISKLYLNIDQDEIVGDNVDADFQALPLHDEVRLTYTCEGSPPETENASSLQRSETISACFGKRFCP